MKKIVFFFAFILPLVGFNQEQEPVKSEDEVTFTEIENQSTQDQEQIDLSERSKPIIEQSNLKDKISTTLTKRNQKKDRILTKSIIKKKSRGGGALSGIFLILGLLIMLSAFGFFIAAAYTFWWVALIGAGALILGFLIMCLFPIIEGGDMAWLGPIIMGFIAAIAGGAALAIWGIIELVRFLVG